MPAVAPKAPPLPRQAFGPQLRHHIPLSEGLAESHLGFQSQLPALHTPGGAADGSSTYVPAAHTGEPD